MIKITAAQQVTVTQVIMIEIDDEVAKRNTKEIEGDKKNVEFHEIHDGYSDAKPDNGEMVLIRYEDEEDESYDTVYFFDAGTEVVTKAYPRTTKVLEKTGFYKLYAGADSDETDEFWYISPKSLSHWGRYPKFNK